MKDRILLKFGKKVKMLREKSKLTQEQLAFRSGLHRTYIGMIERGERNITLINIEKLSKGLNVKIEELFK